MYGIVLIVVVSYCCRLLVFFILHEEKNTNGLYFIMLQDTRILSWHPNLKKIEEGLKLNARKKDLLLIIFGQLRLTEIEIWKEWVCPKMKNF